MALPLLLQPLTKFASKAAAPLIEKAKKLVKEAAAKAPPQVKEVASNIAGIPERAQQVGDLVNPINVTKRGAQLAHELFVQPIARNIAGSALDVVGGVRGQVDPRTLVSTARLPETPISKFLFGKGDVVSTSKRGLEAEQVGGALGARFGGEKGATIGKMAAPLGLAAWMGLETSFEGGAAKKVGKELAESAGRKVAKEGAETLAKKAKTLVDDVIEVGIRENGERAALNVQRMKVTPVVRKQLEKTVRELKPELEKVVGKTLKNADVVEAAKTSDILRRTTTREATLREEAAILKTRQHLAALAEGKEVTPELIETIRNLKSVAADRGRQLQALSIDATSELNTVKVKMLRQIADVVDDTDAIIKAAKGVDFSNAKEATKFYRQFVKPTFGEVLDEFRYMNMLSSPKTHIVNAFSNLIQTTAVRPATRLAAGLVDNVGSRLTGKQQEFYVKQVPAYYKGLANSVGDAAGKAIDVLRGRQFTTNLDLSRIPTGSRVTAWGKIITNGLEASDVFFRTLVEGAERAALETGGKTAAVAAKEASETAAYTVFRKALDTQNLTGQGSVLTAIDKMTDGIQSLGKKAPVIRWFVPFVQTPINILKQGLEYSPLGFTTVVKNTKKAEQIGKALVGSFVFAGAGALAASGRATWSLPENKEEREAFYAAGLQPYAVKVGDKWVKYDKLGPLAYPMAMAAATQWYLRDNPKAATMNNTERLTAVLGGIAEFFSDQSYMQGIGNLVGTVQSIGQGGRGTTNLASQASSVAGQLVPLASLQRWVSRMIDPVFRKPGKEFNVQSVVQNLQRDIPFLSKGVEPYLTPEGEESKRPLPFLNALTPFTVSQEVPVYIQRLRGVRSEARLRDVFTKESDTLKEELVNAIRKDEDIGPIMEKIAAYNAEVGRQVFEGVEKGDPAFTDPVEAKKFVTRYQLGKQELQTAIKKGVAAPRP